jgi:CO/xanthine dehydrogenase Mo-binding subunit
LAFRTIGKGLPRIEGEGKVTGQTKYAADLPFEDLLWAKVLRASVPHARIVKVDTSKAKALKGVRAVLTGADVKDLRRHAGLKTSLYWLMTSAHVR